MEKNMRIIETQDELDELGHEATVWGSSYIHPGVAGSGAPYAKLIDGMWWDYGNDYAVGSDDIIVPAVLVWDGVAQPLE